MKEGRFWREYVTPEQAGEYLGYKLTYIYKLVHEGKLKYQYNIGNCKFFKMSYLKTCKRNTYRNNQN